MLRRKREVWVHAGAYGELKALLPLLDRLHEKYPELEFWVSSNMQEMIDLDLSQIRSYLSRKLLIVYKQNIFRLFLMFFQQRPVLWISSSYFMEAKVLLVCSILNIPVIYLFEGFARVRPRWFCGRLLQLALRTTLGIVTQQDKAKQFEELGMDSERIFQLKSLKFTLGLENNDENLDCSQYARG